MDPVAVVACPEYDMGLVEKAVREAVASVDDPVELLGHGRRVLIKPNLLSDHRPEDGVTTHPSVVRAAIRLVRDAGGIPVVGDSPALKGRTEAAYRRTCKITGILAAVEEEGAELAWLDGAYKQVSFPDGKVQKQFPLSESVASCDLIFNLPKLKTHGLMLLTGGVKNLLGCIPGTKKANYHLATGDRSDLFAESLLDLALYLRPTLTVMDAVVAMEGKGPSNGKLRTLGYIMACRTPWALDWMEAKLVGADPMRAPIIRAAMDRGVLGPPWPELPVAPVDDFALPRTGSGFPRWMVSILQPHMIARPMIKDERCILCGDCRRICPPQAISQGANGRMNINRKGCICCYCCQEVCRQDAIELRKSWLAETIGGHSGRNH